MEYKEIIKVSYDKTLFDKEIIKHGLNPKDFYKDIKGKPTSKKLTQWLGY